MRLLLAVLFCSVMLPSAYAEKLPAPTGKPVLTISGKIGNMNVGDKAVFDLAMLEKLGMKTIETTTPWYTGKVRFDGITLSKLMDLVGAKGTSARVLALNDYTTIIPIDDFYKFQHLFHLISAVHTTAGFLPVWQRFAFAQQEEEGEPEAFASLLRIHF